MPRKRRLLLVLIVVIGRIRVKTIIRLHQKLGRPSQAGRPAPDTRPAPAYATMSPHHTIACRNKRLRPMTRH